MSFKSFNVTKNVKQSKESETESKSDLKNEAKKETNEYLNLLFSQGVTRAEKAFQEKMKSDKMIEINMSQGSNLSFGDNLQNTGFLE
jgi:hypothetical protein